MTQKHIFAGNNSSLGFYSYFDDLLQTEKRNRIYILKGGPGVGKSTFMQKFGKKMVEKGYFTEFVHCSSDNDSLDGVIIPELQIAIVDGTAPHIIDPVFPGAIDEIINLGIYLDSNELEKYKPEIIKLKKEISKLYKVAYRYLECAGMIMDNIQSIYNRYTNENQFSLLSKEILQQLLSDKSLQNSPKGNLRRLFSEAYTSDGYITHTDSLYDGKEVWAILGDNTDYTARLLSSIAETAMDNGYDVEGYYNPLHPDKLQHLYIHELNIFIKSISNHSGNHDYAKIINLYQLIDSEQIDHIELLKNKEIFELLIENAIERLSYSKAAHSKLEVIYKNNINFSGVDQCFEEFISKY